MDILVRILHQSDFRPERCCMLSVIQRKEIKFPPRPPIFDPFTVLSTDELDRLPENPKEGSMVVSTDDIFTQDDSSDDVDNS